MAKSKKIKKVDDLGMKTDIEKFVSHIEGLADSLPLLMDQLIKLDNASEKKFEDYLEKHGTLKKEENSIVTYTFDMSHRSKIRILRKHRQKININLYILPCNFVVSLISQFDFLLGRILRWLFINKPEILYSTEKQLPLSEILKYDSFNELRESIIEKEVESFLRKNHIEQFEWLENKIGIPLRKDLDAWPIFVELTERRNLFVHCDGIISTQYITKCESQGVQLPKKVKVGQRLDVTPDYFFKGYYCIYEIGVKLCHVIWRKILPTDKENAENNYNNIAYELIIDEKYELAIKLLEFAVNDLKKYSSEEIRLYYILNLAQALKWSGKLKQCKDIVAAEDWSACSPKYKLAVSVLLDDFEQACDLMKIIGKNGEIKELDYKEWPIFKEFIVCDEFQETYHKIFGEPFLQIEEKTIEK